MTGMKSAMPWALAALLSLSAAAAAQNVTPSRNEPASAVLAREVPVTAGDILDRPYVVIGRIDTYVQRSAFEGEPDEAKVFRELWERAERMGADAVVNAAYGNPQRNFFRSWGGRHANGQAIRFVARPAPAGE